MKLLTWRRTRLRYFVLLDEHGICQALKRAKDKPASTFWVETNDHHLAWLNHPLPEHTRLNP